MALFKGGCPFILGALGSWFGFEGGRARKGRVHTLGSATGLAWLPAVAASGSVCITRSAGIPPGRGCGSGSSGSTRKRGEGCQGAHLGVVPHSGLAAGRDDLRLGVHHVEHLPALHRLHHVLRSTSRSTGGAPGRSWRDLVEGYGSLMRGRAACSRSQHTYPQAQAQPRHKTAAGMACPPPTVRLAVRCASSHLCTPRLPSPSVHTPAKCHPYAPLHLLPATPATPTPPVASPPTFAHPASPPQAPAKCHPVPLRLPAQHTHHRLPAR